MKLIALFVALLCVPLAFALYPGDPGFRGCVISSADGVFQDVDCDRVYDILDNCPLTPNPEQSDVDSNLIGDACDLVIDEIILEPGEPMQGRSLLVRSGVFNNREYPMRNLVLKIEIPRLGAAVSQPLPVIEPGQRILTEQLLRIPECAPPVPTDIVVFIEYPFAPGQKEVFSRPVRIPIVPSGACPLDPGEELTVVDIIELQDVHPEEGAIYPFTIKNNWPDSKAYILSVQGMETWGVATIEPGSVIVVPPGGARNGLVHVWAYRGQEGMKSFTLTVNARDDAKQVVLQADIPETPQLATSRQGNQLLMGVLTFLAILILVALVIVYMKEKHKQTRVKREMAAQAPAKKAAKKPVKKK